MDFMLLRHRKKSLVVPVPDGLKELMADISREVLRSQPENMELFIADYLEAMLLTRELFYVAEQTVEDVLEAGIQIKELLQQCGMSLTQAESAVHVIKEEFRKNIPNIKSGIEGGHQMNEIDIITRLVTECELTTSQAKKASLIIESSYQHFYDQNLNHSTNMGPAIAWNDNVRNTLTAYQKLRPNTKPLVTSATSNHDIYKGFFERNHDKKAMKYSRIQDQELTKLCKKPREHLEYWQSPLFQEREHSSNVIKSWFKQRREAAAQNKAAILIQSNFKGFMERKKLGIMKPKVCSDGLYWKTPCFQVREKAATIIQSWIRAVQVKKELRSQVRAAKIIQSHYRGFHARKAIQHSKGKSHDGISVTFKEHNSE